MSPRMSLATAARVLRQVRHDPRTIALIVILPCLLLGLVAWMFDGTPVLDTIGPSLLGVFPLIVMFLVTSVTMLRERLSGTLERLMTMPLRRGDVVVGYALAFGLLAALQALVLVTFAVGVCGMNVAGPLWAVILVAVLDAVLGASLGLAVSALARTEFQAVQMMPAFIFPQLILCGLIMPRDQMPAVLEAISVVLPLTYVVDAMQTLSTDADVAAIWGDVAVIAGFIVVAVAVGATTLRRRTP
ncbi:ABC transporter permease [Pengzhenrongella frigida]|uniref:Transport permease protein n=1 Tax=Pengzhenrongella frigida TaxID=1259133 RepID=A0A4Q5MVB2_9MICO|nr:ABC transporter permease [Cellulomonas sp. HLT2-17]RYV49399.1 ABC transporter permease [Cellulomonas sp. HLT2-17]